MKKLFRSLALSGVLAVGAAGLVSLAPETALGQAVKTPQPPVKGKEVVPVKPVEAKGSVTIRKDKQGKFRFFIVGEDDKTIADSTKGYETEADAIKALEITKSLLNSKKPEVEK